ncbi:tRNA uridine(34) 5-carboxymethylaminomethyl modification radical SAM/GNAT enzyme Elp3 [bacterium]|nr:tRNA uridine(34) 5-carboxymethylaminomethyl modification radical SAM/GNAT enzyme Elp3 [bacterium]
MGKVKQNKKVFSLLAKELKRGFDLEKAKKKVAEKLALKQLPRTYEFLSYLDRRNPQLASQIRKKVKIHKIRSLSGIVSVSVLTKPYPCHYKCAYCPKEKGIPQSYLSDEPAVARAKKVKFDPFLQVKNRLKVLERGGHPTDKVELLILGGTFSLLPQKYRQWFVKRCFEAANEKTSRTLIQAQKINERSKHRIIGITIETRPDLIDEREIKFLRHLGITRVELGVQTFFDFLLKKVNRGHGKKESFRAAYLLKESGFKITYHLMLNLPGSNPFLDWLSGILFFFHSHLRPDHLKIYPLMVVKGSLVYKWWQEGKIKTYSKNTLIYVLSAIKKFTPPFIRIIRVIRDIPAQYIEAGVKFSNLRQEVHRFMAQKGLACRCIRCREIKGEKLINPRLVVRRYWANFGKEYFLSIEDKKHLGALLRLRIPHYFLKNKKTFFNTLKNAALIREIHTYGKSVPISKKFKGAAQHQGFGEVLLKKAEEIARREGVKKIAVIAGVGVRGYFRKFGYRLQETYMVKDLTDSF